MAKKAEEALIADPNQRPHEMKTIPDYMDYGVTFVDNMIRAYIAANIVFRREMAFFNEMGQFAFENYRSIPVIIEFDRHGLPLILHHEAMFAWNETCESGSDFAEYESYEDWKKSQEEEKDPNEIIEEEFYDPDTGERYAQRKTRSQVEREWEEFEREYNNPLDDLRKCVPSPGAPKFKTKKAWQDWTRRGKGIPIEVWVDTVGSGWINEDVPASRITAIYTGMPTYDEYIDLSPADLANIEFMTHWAVYSRADRPKCDDIKKLVTRRYKSKKKPKKPAYHYTTALFAMTQLPSIMTKIVRSIKPHEWPEPEAMVEKMVEKLKRRR